MSITPCRKPNRLKNYDYSQNGAYFVTICTKNRENIFGTINDNNIVNGRSVGAASCRPLPLPDDCGRQNAAPTTTIILTEIGKIVENEITMLSSIYPFVMVDKYIVMPNHVHMIIFIENNGRQNDVPTISRIMNQFKRSISIKMGFSPWQKSFHDHIIRNNDEYYRIVKYIENNPVKWLIDNQINKSVQISVICGQNLPPKPSPQTHPTSPCDT